MQPITFFGSDQYSVVVLKQLAVSDKLQILAVVTDLKSPPNPVESLAHELNLPVITYSDLLSNPRSLSPLGLTASFPHLFPPELISLFPHGHLYNLHPSLLPQYRNVAPVPYALAMGDKTTGITIFRIGTGIDNGEIVAQIEEPILPTDTTPILLNRLFAKGANLFLSWFTDKLTNRPADLPNRWRADELIFTHKLTRKSGYLEWPVLQKLLANQPISINETQNELIRLRLIHHPDRTANILPDLVRALAGYEKVWTLADTTKGQLQLSLESLDPVMVKLSGRPKAILWKDFTKYYL